MTNVNRQVIGPWMQEYAETEKLMSQPRRMFISSFELENGTVLNSLLLFYFEPGFVCTNINRFVEYTSVKCFNVFVQSVIDARQRRDENPNSSLNAKKKEIVCPQFLWLSNHGSYSWFCHKISERWQDTAAIKKKFQEISSYQRSTLGSRTGEIRGWTWKTHHCRFLSCSMMNWESSSAVTLWQLFFTIFCDVSKDEVMKRDTESLYLAPAEKVWYNCIWGEKRKDWKFLQTQDNDETFFSGACSNFFPRTCWAKHKKNTTRGSLGCSRRSFIALKCYAYLTKHTVATTLDPTILISVVKD